MEDMLNGPKKGRRARKKSGKRKRKKEILLTPKQRYDQAITLKRAIRCMRKLRDRHMIYAKLTADFAELAALPETEVFEGKENCAALSEECRVKMEELKDQIPLEEEEESRTVTTTAKEQQKENDKGGKGKWIVLAIVLVIVGVAAAFHFDGSRYVIANIENFAGLKEVSVDMFRSLGSYRDSEQRTAELEMKLIAGTRKKGVVDFGDCEWVVIDKKKDAVCLMKREGYTDLTYHEKAEPVTWEKCSLRSYLNQEFLDEHFTPSEREKLLMRDVTAAANAKYQTDAGVPTQDYVYILSAHEYRKCREAMDGRGNNMRLRNPGKETFTTEFVTGFGRVSAYGYPADEPGIVIRPVIWVSLN